MRLPSLPFAPLALLAAACGSGSPSPPGLCDGEACLTSIDDEADWAFVAGPQGGARCDFADESKYIAPAIATASLQETVYQDVKIHRYHVEFLRQVLDEHFAGLTADQYAELLQRRATRQYWGGSLARVVDEQGATVGYGFDVIIDPSDPGEALTEADVEAVHALLSQSFHLPLGYAPRTPDAISAAQGMDLPFDLHLPRSCAPPTECEDPETSCIVVPAAIQVCGNFLDNRTIQVEYARKIQLDLAVGEFALPATGVAELTLLTGGVYGPQRTPVVAAAPGRIEWRTDFPMWEYTQTLTAGGEDIALTWQIYAGAGLPKRVTLAEPELSQEFNAYGVVGAGGTQDDTIGLQSCVWESLPLWHAAGTLGGGDSFTIRIRHMLPFAGSGPMFPISADVTLGGQSVTVDDYFQLVYAGVHHNWNNQYWVVFDAPISYNGHDVYGLWVDEADYTCCPVDGIYTLGPTLEALDTLTVVDYSFMQQ